MRLASFQKLRDGSFQTWDLEVSLQHSGWEICCMTPDCQFERQAKQVGTNVQSEHKTSFLELLDLFKQNVFQTLLQPKRPWNWISDVFIFLALRVLWPTTASMGDHFGVPIVDLDGLLHRDFFTFLCHFAKNLGPLERTYGHLLGLDVLTDDATNHRMSWVLAGPPVVGWNRKERHCQLLHPSMTNHRVIQIAHEVDQSTPTEGCRQSLHAPVVEPKLLDMRLQVGSIIHWLITVGNSQAKALTLSAMSQTRFLESRCSSFGRGWPQKVSTLQWRSNLIVVVVEIHWWSETLLIIFLLGIQKADEFTQSSWPVLSRLVLQRKLQDNNIHSHWNHKKNNQPYRANQFHLHR